MKVSWVSQENLETWLAAEGREPAQKGEAFFSGVLVSLAYDSKLDLYCIVHQAGAAYPRMGWPAR